MRSLSNIETTGTDQPAGLGFPVAATIGGATSILSTVLPSVLGGGAPTRAERIAQERKRQAGMSVIRQDLQNLAGELEGAMTVTEARDVVADSARPEAARLRQEYRTILRRNGIENAELLSRQAAEQGRKIYLDVANRVLFWDNAPTLLAAAGIAAGAGAGLYYWHKNR